MELWHEVYHQFVTTKSFHRLQNKSERILWCADHWPVYRLHNQCCLPHSSQGDLLRISAQPGHLITLVNTLVKSISTSSLGWLGPKTIQELGISQWLRASAAFLPIPSLSSPLRLNGRKMWIWSARSLPRRKPRTDFRARKVSRMWISSSSVVNSRELKCG